MNTDLLPPHSSEAEAGIIGACLDDQTLISELRLEWFFDLRFRTLAKALQQMASRGDPIDTSTVAAAVRLEGSNAATAISECVEACHSPANFSYWRDILREQLAMRSVLRVCGKFQQRVLEISAHAQPDVGQLLDSFEADALGVRDKIFGGGADEVDLRSAIESLVADYDAALRGEATGIATGFPEFDRITGRLKPQTLNVLAGRPSVGKTALALAIALNVAVEKRISIGFFSLEMSGKELVHRLSCSVARVDSSQLNSGSETPEERRRLTAAQAQIVNAPLHICDRGGLTLSQLGALARRMAQRHKIEFLVVDYLGLLRSGERGRSRYEETTLVSNGLKTLAKDLRVPVIALAQLNRDTEREDRPPRLSDLRDSGAIEQDADLVGLLHKIDSEDDIDRITLSVAKNRSGPTGRLPLVFQRRFTRFESATNLHPNH